MKRSSSRRVHERALGRADVGDHAVLGRRRERRADLLGQRPHRAAAEAGRRRPRAPRSSDPAARSIAPSSAPRSSRSAAAPEADHLGRRRCARARPGRSSRRSARRRGSAILIRASTPAPLAHGSRQPVEHVDGRVPVHAGVGDRLAVGERPARSELLAARPRGTTPASRPTIAVLPPATWPATSARHRGLARRGPCRCCRARRRPPRARAGRPRASLASASATPVGVVVRGAAPAAQDDVAVGVAARCGGSRACRSRRRRRMRAAPRPRGPRPPPPARCRRCGS